MRVTKADSVKVCAVCERTLLMGEHAVRFSPDGRSSVDVCTLCQDVARDHGWTREGLASVAGYELGSRRRRQRPLWQVLLGSHAEEPDPVVAEPQLRRLSEGEITLVEAADLFNQSQFRRTILSVTKSLGPPSVSVIPLSGVSGETVITFAWDITWYQYRVSPESAQAVQIAERGTDVDEIEPAFREWNAHLDELGRLVPELELV